MGLPTILRKLLRLPTAPLAEAAVLQHIRTFCGQLRGVSCRSDRHGNLLARYRHLPPRVTPLVFTAHTDHPGFLAQEMWSRRTVRAAFLGYVESPYCVQAAVRFWSAGRWVPGQVLQPILTTPVNRAGRVTTRPEEVLAQVAQPVEPGSLGMWDLPEASVKRGLIQACALDDLAGVGAMLALLERLSRRRIRADTYCLFTRAEEVGLVGAVGAVRARTLPRRLPIIAIEMSRELPHARVGDGPILRVGDRMSVFTPDLTAFCGRVARNLARRRPSFLFQRKLMDGGTCESTAYAAYGYHTAGICLALANYHNMGDEDRITSECVSLRDWQSLVDWFEALVVDRPGYRPDVGVDADVIADLNKRFESYAPLLTAPPTRPTSETTPRRAR